jgi:hypothetical protein
MNTRTKEILKEGILIYNAMNDKQAMISKVEENLSIHYNGIKTIGIGLDEDKVAAGEIFLRIFKTKS